jgi:protein SCO1/2
VFAQLNRLTPLDQVIMRCAMVDAAPAKKVPFYRTFWFWAFVVGVIFLAAIRGCTRHIPDPPKVLGAVPEWNLVSQDDQPFGSANLKGHVYVVGFFFSSCVTICPHLQQAMKSLQDRYEKDGLAIRLVSISVDPEADEPEVLTQYGKAIGADFERWTFITGEEKAVRGLVVDGFRTFMGEKEELPERPGVFDVGHGGRLILVDADGNARGHYEVLQQSDDARAWSVDEQGVDEIFHRSKHVLRATQQAPGTAFSCSMSTGLR